MRHRNLSEQLLHELGKQIVNDDLLPGDVLPKVETLSEINGVSRTVTREALKGLIARRFVESSTKVGTVIKDSSEWQWWDPDVMSWAATSKNSKKFLLQLTEVRLAIEPAAVQLAARNATDKDILTIKNCYDALEASLESEAKWVIADYEFHNSILLASHNVLMLSLVKTMYSGLIQSRQATIRALKEESKQANGEPPSKEVLLRHKDVMEAICDRNDKLAYQKMHELLMRVVQLIENQEQKS